MASSNNAMVSDGIILKVQKNFESRNERKEVLSIADIANTLSQECKNKITEEKERQVYSLFGLSENEFKGNSIKISALVVEDIIDRLREFKYEFEFEFIVFGFDVPPIAKKYIPHIYKINHLGEVDPSDHIGFAITGSGSYLAFPEMTKYPYHPATPLSESVLRVYWSKKVAERVQGVGNETDLAVLFVDPKEGVKIWEAKPDLKTHLNTKLNEIRTYETNATKELLEELAKTAFAPPPTQ